MIKAEPALDLLHEFREHLERNRDIHRRLGDEAAQGDESACELTELEPLIEKIAASVESDPERRRPPRHVVNTADMWIWSNRVDWVARLIGILENCDRLAEIFAQAGPNLAASQFIRGCGTPRLTSGATVTTARLYREPPRLSKSTLGSSLATRIPAPPIST